MARCWNVDPYTRPTFTEIVQVLQSSLCDAQKQLTSRIHDEPYANVPETQSLVEWASSGDSALPPLGGACAAPVQRSSDDYLTASEHYFPSATSDISSEYLTSPRTSDSIQRLLSVGSISGPVEHGDEGL